MEPMQETYNPPMETDYVEPMEGEEQATPPNPQDQVDSEIRSMILRRKEASRQHKQEKKEIWDKCWNHYKQRYDRTNKESWQSGTFIPASPKVAEVITSNMHSALLAPDRPVEYQARQPMFERTVRDVNDLIAVDCDRSEFKVHWTDIIRTNNIIGTGIGKVEYRKEYATVSVKERVRTIPGMDMMRQMIGLPPAPTESTTQKRMLVKDHSSTTNVDPYNFFPEPGSTEISKDHWCIEEGKICNYRLLELQQDPENPIRNVNEDLLTNNPSNLETNGDKQERDTALDEPVKPTAYMNPDQEHVLDEYWGPAPIWMVQPELYGKEEYKYTMVHAWFWLIDGQHVVRSQVTPFRDAEPPYIKIVYIRVPGQFWGIGPLELMIGLQIELNEIRNTRQDEINVKLNKPMAVNKDFVDVGDWGRLKLGPGALWPFKNTDDVRKALSEINLDANMAESWRASMEIMSEIQEVTGAVKAVVGNDGGSGQNEAGTFRGQMLNRQVASERFIMYARILEITGLGRAYKKMYHRIYQYKDWKEAEVILGEERAANFEFVAPEDLDKMAKLVPLGVTTMENKGVKLAQMAEQFKMFMGQEWFKAVDFARRMVVTGGDNDPDMYIMSEEEMQQLNDMKRKLMAEGMQMAGGGMGSPPDMGMTSSPVAGNVPGPTDGQPRPAMPPRGPGASPIDSMGMPL
jgi:hypothetical protein